MTLASNSEKIFMWFGKYISPAFVSASIAGAKGIFRPIFTLSDKKQDKDSRVYAALREGITEVIAIPVYLGSGALAKAISKKLARPKDMTKELFNAIIDKKVPFDVNKLAGTVYSEADAAIAAKNFFKMNGTLSMLGVFASALIIIPVLCTEVIRPIMRSIKKNNEKKAAADISVVQTSEINQKQIYNNQHKPLDSAPVFKAYSCGMKVGGV